MLWPNEATEVTNLTDDYYIMVGTANNSRPQKAPYSNFSSKYLRHYDSATNAHTDVYWGGADDQKTMGFYGWGFQSGPPSNPAQFKYVWALEDGGGQYFTRWDRIIGNTEFRRWMIYNGDKLRFFINTPYSSIGNSNPPGGVEVFAADNNTINLLSAGNGSPRVAFSSGTDTGGNPFTVINGTPDTNGAPYFFARVGANYSAYYFQQGRQALTYLSGQPVTLWDGLGNSTVNRGVEITTDKVKVIKKLDVGILLTTAQDVQGSINELKTSSGGSSGSVSVKTFYTEHNATPVVCPDNEEVTYAFRIGSWNMTDANSTSPTYKGKVYLIQHGLTAAQIRRITSATATITDNQGNVYLATCSANAKDQSNYGNGNEVDFWVGQITPTTLQLCERNGGNYQGEQNKFSGDGLSGWRGICTIKFLKNDI